MIEERLSYGVVTLLGTETDHRTGVRLYVFRLWTGVQSFRGRTTVPSPLTVERWVPVMGGFGDE